MDSAAFNYAIREYMKKKDKNHINPNLGGIRVQSLQPGDIKDMAETLSKRKLSPKTVKNVITVLHTALAYTGAFQRTR